MNRMRLSSILVLTAMSVASLSGVARAQDRINTPSVGAEANNANSYYEGFVSALAAIEVRIEEAMAADTNIDMLRQTFATAVANLNATTSGTTTTVRVELASAINLASDRLRVALSANSGNPGDLLTLSGTPTSVTAEQAAYYDESVAEAKAFIAMRITSETNGRTARQEARTTFEDSTRYGAVLKTYTEEVAEQSTLDTAYAAADAMLDSLVTSATAAIVGSTATTASSNVQTALASIRDFLLDLPTSRSAAEMNGALDALLTTLSTELATVDTTASRTLVAAGFASLAPDLITAYEAQQANVMEFNNAVAARQVVVSDESDTYLTPRTTAQFLAKAEYRVFSENIVRATDAAALDVRMTSYSAETADASTFRDVAESAVAEFAAGSFDAALATYAFVTSESNAISSALSADSTSKSSAYSASRTALSDAYTTVVNAALSVYSTAATTTAQRDATAMFSSSTRRNAAVAGLTADNAATKAADIATILAEIELVISYAGSSATTTTRNAVASLQTRLDATETAVTSHTASATTFNEAVAANTNFQSVMSQGALLVVARNRASASEFVHTISNREYQVLVNAEGWTESSSADSFSTLNAAGTSFFPAGTSASTNNPTAFVSKAIRNADDDGENGADGLETSVELVNALSVYHLRTVENYRRLVALQSTVAGISTAQAANTSAIAANTASIATNDRGILAVSNSIDEIKSGVAVVSALGGLPSITGKRLNWSISLSSFSGKSAFGSSIRVNSSSRFAWGVGAAIGEDEQTGGNIAFSIGF